MRGRPSGAIFLRIKRMSSHVEGEADVLRMRKDEDRYHEVLQLLASIKVDKEKEKDQQPVRYDNIPFSMNPKFSGRQDILETVHNALGPDASSPSTKSIALFGTGGVGKTQIAIQYAYRNQDQFDIVLWIAADNAITMSQSFRVIAEGLGLLNAGEEPKDTIWAVRNWLSTTKTTCLVVFDNADDLAALKLVQPGSTRGSVLITTRDFTVATTIPSQHVQVTALAEDEGSKMLLKVIGSENALPSDIQDAIAISRAFSGLPLALTQIGGFITQRKLSLRDFLPLYKKHSSKIDSRKAPGSDYEYTLSSVWDVSFGKLTEDSTRLLNVLSFFDPDCIPEEILTHGSSGFLADEMDLGDASEELLCAALVNRNSESAVLTVHRLVQSAARRRLSESKSIKFFDATVHMLCWGFPDHSKVDIGHQVSAWERCEKCLSHVNRLVELSDQPKNKYTAGDKQKYADLLLQCSW
ncbi:P-loop containing nucleoside triphosphate hydrolase protein [Chaetomium tenue]|uniref:P-loop containing nucleoside triphosphate hydrolase protein n=1 Tax=Chaetomium tenue TaxID=1854479 RepID=A0ACB7P4X6_9PEZI|nr:P-loop containing nucleoside triphosphate hydrolase protein [Chaetomium globosum]